MIIFAPVIESQEIIKQPVIPKYEGCKMSLAEFKNWEPDIEEGIKYEWNNGVLEATDKLKFDEQKIIRNLQRKFHQTSAYKNGDELCVEVECYFPKINKLKIPDMCYLKKYQVDNCNQPNVDQVPLFVIEILSPSNTVTEMEKKIQEYFIVGTKVVWTIYPELQKVKIYYSPKQVKICTDIDTCDTAEVIPSFLLTVDEIFQ